MSTPEEDVSLWSTTTTTTININNNNNNNNTSAVSELNSCEHVRAFAPFSTIRTNATQVNIDYERSQSTNDHDEGSDNDDDELSFMLVARLVPRQTTTTTSEHACADATQMECRATADEASSSSSPSSCIDRSLLCNCMSSLASSGQGDYDACDHLIGAYGTPGFVASASSCSYLLELNARCRRGQSSLSPQPSAQLLRATASDDDESVGGDGDEGPFLFDPTAAAAVANEAQLKTIEESDDTDRIIEWSGASCQNVIRTGEFGWISSPNLHTATKKATQNSNNNNNYDYDLNCTYRIIVQPYQLIQIRFGMFNLNSNLVLEEDAANAAEEGDDNVATSNLTSVQQQPQQQQQHGKLSRFIDFDYLSIYDGASVSSSPLLVRLTAAHNDFARYLDGRTFNSASNQLLIVFHTQSAKYRRRSHSQSSSSSHHSLDTGRGATTPQTTATATNGARMGFNLTYQIKGYCIDNQRACSSIYELDCYSPSQTCNDVWDCQNGADERGCGPCRVR